MLHQITPLIITYNEEANVARSLKQLSWARDIVVIDSLSTDRTRELIADFRQARVFQREFDNFAAQCNFGLHETAINNEWVLSLDADYILTDEIVEEMARLSPDASTSGFRASFVYCVYGRKLRSGIYPPRTVLFRRAGASYVSDGHSHRLDVKGSVQKLNAPILHDDRKPLSRWFDSQRKYLSLEAAKLSSSDPKALNTADRVRRMRLLAPLAIVFYCLIMRGGVLDGWPGFYYAFQRMVAELLLSLYLLEEDFMRVTEPRSNRTSAEPDSQTTIGNSLNRLSDFDL